MEFTFAIGTKERHQVHFKRNWFTGKLAILVDSRPVITKSPLNPGTHISVKLSHSYDFPVGDQEKHSVRIRENPPALPRRVQTTHISCFCRRESCFGTPWLLTSSSGLTLSSTRTPPALSSAPSLHSASPAPLIASVQAGPVSFIR